MSSLDLTEIVPEKGIKKWFKVTVLNFKEKLFISPNVCKWVNFGPKITTLTFF